MVKEAQQGDGPLDIDRAVGAVLLAYANGIGPADILRMGKPGIPEMNVPPGIITKELVDRVGKWQAFYLEAFRRGWHDTGFPKAEQIANEFFGGDLDNTFMATRMIQAWLNAVMPQDKLQRLMIEGAKMVAAGATHEEVRNAYETNLQEPKKTVVSAYWNTQARTNLHKKR